MTKKAFSRAGVEPAPLGKADTYPAEPPFILIVTFGYSVPHAAHEYVRGGFVLLFTSVLRHSQLPQGSVEEAPCPLLFPLSQGEAFSSF